MVVFELVGETRKAKPHTLRWPKPNLSPIHRCRRASVTSTRCAQCSPRFRSKTRMWQAKPCSACNSPNAPRYSLCQGVVPHFNASREMVKNSATDRRSMSIMEDAVLDFDKLVSSMSLRTDAMFGPEHRPRAEGYPPTCPRYGGEQLEPLQGCARFGAASFQCERLQHFGRTARDPCQTVLVGSRPSL